MTSHLYFAADVCYLVGASLLILKFVTWEEHKHKNTSEKILHIIYCIVAAGIVTVFLVGFNHYLKNKLSPQSSIAANTPQPSGTPPETKAQHTAPTNHEPKPRSSPTIKQDTARDKRRALKDRLGVFLFQGREIRNLLSTNDALKDDGAEIVANSWSKNAQEFIGSNLGSSYVARFIDDTWNTACTARYYS